MRDRIEAEGRILFAAAQADGHVEGPEVTRILGILEREWAAAGLGERLPTEFMDELSSFDGKAVSMADLARPFRDESETARRRILELVVNVHEADGELDYAEDTFVRELGFALGLSEGQFSDLLLEIFEPTPGTEPKPVPAPAPAPAKTVKKPAAKAKKKPAAKAKKKPAAKAKKPAAKAKKPAKAKPKNKTRKR